jgi:hypothetical protein
MACLFCLVLEAAEKNEGNGPVKRRATDSRPLLIAVLFG